MSDSGFREIQLSGKHVVFLFMAGAVAAIAIFLLGVSVGRGVIKPDANAAPPVTSAAPVTDAGASQQLPPPTLPSRGELQYQGILQGKTDPPTATPSPSPSATPGTDALTTKPAATPEPPAPPAAKPVASAPKGAADGEWYVQTDSFASRDNALRRISQLKAKGFTATLYTAPGSGARYKVRMGPYDLEGADAMVARLRKEGYSPSRTR